MINNNPLNRPRPKSGLFTGPKMPRLSLNLHTMPQTSTGHFKKWLVLGLLIFGLMIIIAFLFFGQ